MKSMDIHQVIKRLPHRYPFLLVDRVLELEDGKRIKALKNVTINEPFFVGHFPNRPVMPGVLMLEALAQTSALLSMIPEGEELAPDVLYYFVGIDNARFKRPVEPGDQLILEITIDRAGHIVQNPQLLRLGRYPDGPAHALSLEGLGQRDA